MNYYTITSDILETGLKGNELLVFAIINSMTQGNYSCFYCNRTYLSKMTNCNSLRTIDNSLKHLIEKGLIKKQLITKENGEKVLAFYSIFEKNVFDMVKFTDYLLQDIISVERDLFFKKPIERLNDNTFLVYINYCDKDFEQSTKERWELYINRQLNFWNIQKKTAFKVIYKYISTREAMQQ